MSAIQQGHGASPLGGDPARHAEFALLNDELAKLAHPACPDIDWLRVEQLCQRLFRVDGPQLQTAAAYALARSHLQGVSGMIEGIAVLEPLIACWGYLWPRPGHARAAIVCGLFEQMHSVLRTQHGQDAARDELDARLARLADALGAVAPQTLPGLQTLRRCCGFAQQRGPAVLAGPVEDAKPWLAVTPVIHLSTTLAATPHPPRSRLRHVAVWLGVLLMVLGGAGAGLWLSAEPSASPPPHSVQLDNLILFEPGSSRIRPGSQVPLQALLQQVQAHPGWWVVITGHADSQGRTADNLQLSRERAEAVGDWLRTQGNVSQGCLLIQGLADARPIADNATSPGRVVNRRVEVQLLRHAQDGAQSTCDR